MSADYHVGLGYCDIRSTLVCMSKCCPQLICVVLCGRILCRVCVFFVAAVSKTGEAVHHERFLGGAAAQGVTALVAVAVFPLVFAPAVIKPGLLDNALNFWLMHFFEYPKMHVTKNALRAQTCM